MTRYACLGCGADAPYAVKACDCPTRVVLNHDTGKNEWCDNGEPDWKARALAAEAALAADPPQEERSDPLGLAVGDDNRPIPMLLFCPKCGVQHVDAPDPGAGLAEIMTLGVNDKMPWTNPPHKSHLCHACGCIWRPADVPTEGVASITTKGKADNWSGDDNHKALVEALQDAKEADTYERGCEILELAVTAFLARKEEKQP